MVVVSLNTNCVRQICFDNNKIHKTCLPCQHVLCLLFLEGIKKAAMKAALKIDMVDYADIFLVLIFSLFSPDSLENLGFLPLIQIFAPFFLCFSTTWFTSTGGASAFGEVV